MKMVIDLVSALSHCLFSEQHVHLTIAEHFRKRIFSKELFTVPAVQTNSNSAVQMNILDTYTFRLLKYRNSGWN